MSLTSLPDELLTIIFRRIAFGTSSRGPLSSTRDFNNLALTCKRLLGIANEVRKFLPLLRRFDILSYDNDCLYHSTIYGPREYRQKKDDRCKDNEALIAPRPCPLHPAEDENCHYDQLEPLTNFKFIQCSDVAIYSINFRESNCILVAEEIKWHRITNLRLSGCRLDHEILGKLLTKLTNLMFFDFRQSQLLEPQSSHDGERQLLLRKSLEDITFENSHHDLFCGQYFDLPAKRVTISFKDFEETLTTPYVARNEDSIEFVRLVLESMYDPGGFGRRLHEAGLGEINYQVYNPCWDRMTDANCLRCYDPMTNKNSYRPLSDSERKYFPVI